MGRVDAHLFSTDAHVLSQDLKAARASNRILSRDNSSLRKQVIALENQLADERVQLRALEKHVATFKAVLLAAIGSHVSANLMLEAQKKEVTDAT